MRINNYLRLWEGSSPFFQAGLGVGKYIQVESTFPTPMDSSACMMPPLDASWTLKDLHRLPPVYQTHVALLYPVPITKGRYTCRARQICFQDEPVAHSLAVVQHAQATAGTPEKSTAATPSRIPRPDSSTFLNVAARLSGNPRAEPDTYPMSLLDIQESHFATPPGPHCQCWSQQLIWGIFSMSLMKNEANCVQRNELYLGQHLLQSLPDSNLTPTLTICTYITLTICTYSLDCTWSSSHLPGNGLQEKVGTCKQNF